MISISRIVGPPWIGRLLGAAAVAGGFVAAFYALGLAILRPHEHWPFLALLAAVVGGLPVRGWQRAVLLASLGTFTAKHVIPPTLFDAEDWQSLRIHCYTAIIGGILLLGLLGTAMRRSGVLVWALMVGGGAGLLFWAGNAIFAELAAALAAMLLVVGLAARGEPAYRGATAVAAVLHPALLAAGCFNNFSEVPTWAFVVVALAPLVAIPLRRDPSPRRERSQ